MAKTKKDRIDNVEYHDELTPPKKKDKSSTRVMVLCIVLIVIAIIISLWLLVVLANNEVVQNFTDVTKTSLALLDYHT